MEPNEGKRGSRAREQRRQFERICCDLLIFQVDALGQYHPGDAFWEFAFPGRPDAVRAYHFQGGYGGQIPGVYADRIDDLLIQWVTKKISCAEAGRKMEVLCDEVRQFREREVAGVGERSPTEEEKVFAVVSDHLLESLLKLRDEIVIDERRQADAAVMIQRFRNVLLPGYSHRGDRPLGRG